MRFYAGNFPQNIIQNHFNYDGKQREQTQNPPNGKLSNPRLVSSNGRRIMTEGIQYHY